MRFKDENAYNELEDSANVDRISGSPERQGRLDNICSYPLPITVGGRLEDVDSQPAIASKKGVLYKNIPINNILDSSQESVRRKLRIRK